MVGLPNSDNNFTNNDRRTDRRTDGQQTTYGYSALHSISYAAASAVVKISDKVEVS